jgi:hypothetical protein
MLSPLCQGWYRGCLNGKTGLAPSTHLHEGPPQQQVLTDKGEALGTKEQEAMVRHLKGNVKPVQQPKYLPQPPPPALVDPFASP